MRPIIPFGEIARATTKLDPVFLGHEAEITLTSGETYRVPFRCFQAMRANARFLDLDLDLLNRRPEATTAAVGDWSLRGVVVLFFAWFVSVGVLTGATLAAMPGPQPGASRLEWLLAAFLGASGWAFLLVAVDFLLLRRERVRAGVLPCDSGITFVGAPPRLDYVDSRDVVRVGRGHDAQGPHIRLQTTRGTILLPLEAAPLLRRAGIPC